MKQALLFVSLFLFLFTASAQKAQNYSFKKAMASGLMESKREMKIESLYGREVLVVKEEDTKDVIWLKDIQFENGTIELDMKGRDGFQTSFIGIAFNVTDDTTYEAIYFRPFNFRAKDSVRRIHAVQYINHPTYTWQKLRTEFNALYEKEIVDPPAADDWFHARIVVDKKIVSVYVNDQKTPSLVVKSLSNLKSTRMGLWVGDPSDAKFANLSITKK